MVKAYIKYRAEVHQVSQKTIEHDESRLRHLLLRAENTPFSKIANNRPNFPEYLATARLDRKEKPLSVSYSTNAVRTARCFFSWLKEYRRGYGSIPPAWVEALRPPRKATGQRPVKSVPMDEIYAMARTPAAQLWEKRIRAAAILLFLSGLRISALVLLPLNAVDLPARTIKQWPSLGVRTKFGKHATTYLLDIPELMEVVVRWDELV